MPSLISSPTPTVDNTTGAVFLGAIGASILYGITTLQVYLYYHRYLHDSRLHKVSVGVLWTLDTLHQALTIHAAYYLAFKSSGATTIVWSTKLQVAINVVIVLIVQSLYAYRVWKLSGFHHGYLGYIASVVAAGFVVGVAFAYQVYAASTFESLQGITWAIDTSLATSTTIDFIISLAMCYYLRKSRGSEQRLNSKISTVMQYTLSSGLFTSAVSLSTLFTFTLMPNNLIFLGLQLLVTKFYVGSFLAMLNARNTPTKGSVDPELAGSQHSGISLRSNQFQFRVQTTVHTHTETDGGSHGPASPETMTSDRSGLSRTTTYVSYDERSKKDPDAWTVDIESPASAVTPLQGTERYVASRDRRPDYMTQW
ncbi:hypothetical protein K435DRAFT_871487 [Dendrothele bispora CBS 962.96]|uniref:DUF6534 domain-containing protein n=1 Tax=Dendrothele bispora (strain CBS 962.96) TaxID=1314807 RepID=A0A4S8L3X1_DENBC|nr:hypothetical protein K435DRAFT_871487 [Dendrothele bispora CBS 962.96]